MSTSWMLCSSSVPAPTSVLSPRHVLRVVALDGDELVVAEHDGHHPAGGRVVDEVLGPEVGGRAAQHEADLVGDARGVGQVGHRARASAVVNASGFSQNTCSPRATAASQQRGCSLVQVQMYTASQPSSTSSSMAHTVWPLAAANAAARSASGSNTPARTTWAPLCLQALRVVGGDEAGPEEADAQPVCVTVRSACQTGSSPSARSGRRWRRPRRGRG